MQKAKQSEETNHVLAPQRSVSDLLRKSGLSPRRLLVEIRKSLLFFEAVLKNIKRFFLERENKRERIPIVLSGRKNKFIQYAENGKRS